jgi:hypothetical protein
LLLAPAAAGAAPQLRGVRVDKILYYRNSPASATVAVSNPDDQPGSGRLRCLLLSDLDRSRVVYDAPVTLRPEESREVRVDWNTGAEEYGFELRAVLLDAAGQEIAAAGDYFSVADNLWKVAITGAGLGGYFSPARDWRTFAGPAGEQYLATFPLVARRTHDQGINWIEYYAWAPDDFFDLAPAPDRERWWSATGPYRIFRREIEALIAAANREGIRSVTYAQPFATGDATFRMLREHPEYFAYDDQGHPAPAYGTTFSTRGYDALVGDLFGRNMHDPSEVPYPPNSIFLNLADLKVVDLGLDAIIKSARMFGWAGVRWDNAFYIVRGNLRDWQGRKISAYGDPDALTVRNEQHARERLQQALGPSFVLGHNSGMSNKPLAPRGFDEICRGGELFMSEGPRQGHQIWPTFEQYRDFIMEEGNYVRALGANYLVIGFDQQYFADQVYLQVLTFAGRAHPYSYQYRWYDTRVPGQYVRLATRYSCLIWDVERVRPLEHPEERVEVTAPREVWWKPFATRRDLGAGHEQIILHLVNPPAEPRIYARADAPLPAPIPQVTVKCRLASKALQGAWLITAEPKLRQERLEAKVTDDEAVVEVGPLGVWDMVVFDLAHPGRRSPGGVTEAVSLRPLT